MWSGCHRSPAGVCRGPLIAAQTDHILPLILDFHFGHASSRFRPFSEVPFSRRDYRPTISPNAGLLCL